MQTMCFYSYDDLTSLLLINLSRVNTVTNTALDLIPRTKHNFE